MSALADDGDLTCDSGSEGELIGLVLEEYRTLRQELGSRMTGRLQLLAFIVAGAGLAANAHNSIFAIIAAFVIIVGIYIWTRLKRGIERLAEHVAGLEVRINELAKRGYGVTGEVLT